MTAQKTIQLNTRVSSKSLRRWDRAAGRVGLPTETWCKQVLRRAAGMPSLCELAQLDELDDEQFELDAQIVFRVAAKEQRAFRAQARRLGVNGSEWRRAVLDKAVQRKEST